MRRLFLLILWDEEVCLCATIKSDIITFNRAQRKTNTLREAAHLRESARSCLIEPIKATWRNRPHKGLPLLQSICSSLLHKWAFLFLRLSLSEGVEVERLLSVGNAAGNVDGVQTVGVLCSLPPILSAVVTFLWNGPRANKDGGGGVKLKSTILYFLVFSHLLCASNFTHR